MDKRRGMFLGALLMFEKYNSNEYILDDSSQSKSLQCFRILDECLRQNNQSYPKEEVFEKYFDLLFSESCKKAETFKEKVKCFEDYFELDPFRPFEDYPQKEHSHTTGKYLRTCLLSAKDDLDSLIYDQGFTDPYIESFECVYTFSSVLYMLLHEIQIPLILDHFDNKFEYSHTRLIKECLEGNINLNTDLNKVEWIPDYEDLREYGVIVGAIVGAMQGYHLLCQDKKIYYQSLKVKMPLIPC